jgi:hypothetical protein
MVPADRTRLEKLIGKLSAKGAAAKK